MVEIWQLFRQQKKKRKPKLTKVLVKETTNQRCTVLMFLG